MPYSLTIKQRTEAIMYYFQLPLQKRKQLFDEQLLSNLKCINETGYDFFPELKPEIEKAMIESDAMRTPWFFHEYVMDYAGYKLKLLTMRELQNQDYIIVPSDKTVIIN